MDEQDFVSKDDLPPGYSTEDRDGLHAVLDGRQQMRAVFDERKTRSLRFEALRLGLGLGLVIVLSGILFLGADMDGRGKQGQVSRPSRHVASASPVFKDASRNCVRGEVLVERLIENLGSARWSGPPRSALWRLVGRRWSIHRDPFVTTHGRNRPPVVVVGLERRMPPRSGGRHGVKVSGSVAGLATESSGQGGDGKHMAARWHIDRLVSNRRALLLNGGSRIEFPVSQRGAVRFEADLAVLRAPRHAVGSAGTRHRGGGNGRTGPRRRGAARHGRVASRQLFSMRIGVRRKEGKTEWVFRRKLSCSEEEIWEHVALDMHRSREIRQVLVEVDGPSDRVVALGNPELWAAEGCRPGPNVLLVIFDAVRADAVDWTGKRGNWTPNLAALGRRGVVFEKAYSGASRTRASMTSMLTSQWPAGLGLPVGHDKLTYRTRAAVLAALRERLFTRVLQKGGYRTAAIGNNFYFLGHTVIGLDRALDFSLEVEGVNKDAQVIADRVGGFLEQNRDRPFFLWVHFEGGHAPYRPPLGWAVHARAPGAPSDQAFEQYLGAIHWTDAQFGKILHRLHDTGLDRNTIVVVTADHGEVFSRAHSFVINETHTRHHHGWSAYDEVFHVPLVVAGPGLAQGRKVTERVCHLDLVPTLAHLMGRRLDAPVQGQDLGPLVRSHQDVRLVKQLERRLAERPILSQAKAQWSLLDGRWHFIRRWGVAQQLWIRDRFELRKNELYDLVSDPGETRNLAGRHPEIVRRLFRLARDHFGRAAARHRMLARSPGPRLCFSLMPSFYGASCQAEILLQGRGIELSEALGSVRVRWKGLSGGHPRTGSGGGRGEVSKLPGRENPGRGQDRFSGLRIFMDGGRGDVARVCVLLPSGLVRIAGLSLAGQCGSPKFACGAYGLHCSAGDVMADLRGMTLVDGRPAGIDAQEPGTLWIWREDMSLYPGGGYEPAGGAGAQDEQVDGLLRSWGYSSGSPSRGFKRDGSLGGRSAR